MQRLMYLAMVTLPVTVSSLGCGVTDRQLQDFAYSTAVRVLVQTVVNILEASILQGAGQG
ncbi:MAG: hypothetical protein GXY55_05185 [Phycisphaerae bacterium]|nr:hypothetical protein [Phycisphaerae bacterium]